MTLVKQLTWWDFVWVGWLAVFLGLELAAVFGAAPWATLSTTSWGLEAWWSPMRLLLEAFLAVLLLHICFRLSASALIFVVIVAAVTVAIHLADRYL